MRQHPLDREVSLAGIGRAEHGGDACAGSAVVGGREGMRRKGHDFRRFLRRWNGGKCFTMRRIWGRGLSSGTVAERIAPESRLLPAPASFTATSRVDAFGTALDQAFG